MGDPSRKRKLYSRPRKPWDKTRLESERKLRKTYGIKSKRELWKTEAAVRQKRQSARKLLALSPQQREKAGKELVQSLNRIGVLKPDAMAEDILSLNMPELLERRLQTMVVRKGLANTPKQARQFIVHGHISVNHQRVTAPSYLVRTNETIGYYGKPMVLKAPEPKAIKKESVEEPEEKEAPEGERTEEKGEIAE